MGEPYALSPLCYFGSHLRIWRPAQRPNAHSMAVVCRYDRLSSHIDHCDVTGLGTDGE